MLNTVTFDQGEPVYTLDDNKLYIGDGVTTADNLNPVNPSLATTDLSDVSSLTPSNDTFLVYNSSNNRYESEPLTIATLPEVHAVPTLANQVLAYDDNVSNPSYGKLAPTTLTLNFLADVTLTSIQNGDTIVWDSALNTFVNQAGGGGSTLASMTDVTITFAQQNDMLIYDTFTSTWINQPFALEVITSLGFLVNAADDTAAASGGVPVGAVYRNGSVLQVRVT